MLSLVVFFYHSGRELWVLALGPNANRHVHLRPEVKYVGNMHGNEVSTTLYYPNFKQNEQSQKLLLLFS